MNQKHDITSPSDLLRTADKDISVSEIGEMVEKAYERLDETATEQAKKGYRENLDWLHIYYNNLFSSDWEVAAIASDNEVPPDPPGDTIFRATYSLKEEDLTEKARRMLRS